LVFGTVSIGCFGLPMADRFQFTSGGVAYLGGLIIGKSITGEMTHFPLVGGVATACALLSICLVRSIKIPIAETPDVNARPRAR
jgi:hypothetical protein